MAILVGSARIDENGKIAGGAVGDQNGREVALENFYVHSQGWFILRPISVAHAKAIAERMKAACNNPCIGYDQYNRLGVITYGINTKTNTECDCSSLVRECVKEGTGKDPGNFTTDNEASKLLATGLFEKITFVSLEKTPVYDGDILVTKTKGHTVVVVSGNPREEASVSNNSKLAFSVGDIVMFNGTRHYTSANAKIGPTCKKGLAKVTAIAENSKHPYHLVRVSGKGSTVYGWVDAPDVSKASVTTTPAKTSSYYNKYTGSSGRIDEVFKAIGVPSKYIKDASGENYTVRKPVAEANGISSYTGSASQNNKLISLARQGKLKKA